ncbi:MAG: hypothetical protein GWN01_07655 [Nitrosopumilaceae archaeon]|nr:hypothetical protein [Nitrosopumilaceae archaeon]NIU00795.1 hypothetical protein [Nitrosopumilaceae archaeon]NIU87248.1 hypothetical protein [Nitrosopumilaceae archaeon]NIV65776.1 hypothetical protein [Nitrosopumilaceae archaeon]NIX61397.1 hypothetical protein [Nitrosopumilaceae archaeon]
MQYFQAVQKGKQVASKSQMKLFNIAGFAMLTLTTKKVNGKFYPVGEDDYTALIKTPDGHVTILVDGDGYTKAQTKAIPKEEAVKIFKKVLESGIPRFSGKEVEIWTEKYPTIQDIE